MAIATAGPRPARVDAASASVRSALAGYAFIAIPMLLFLVLNIGSIFYAVFISVFQWNIRSGAGKFIGIAELPDRPQGSDLHPGDPELALLRRRSGSR